MSSHLRTSLAFASAFLLMTASAAVGAPSSSVSRPLLAASGVCPSSEAVWASVSALVPGGALDAVPSAATIAVSDLGDNYRVAVSKGEDVRERTYRDVARDCEQRARFAAVFIVLTFMPPELMVEPAKPVSVVGLPAQAFPTLEAPPPRWRLELGVFWDAAPAILGAPSTGSPGGELRLALGRQRLRGIVGMGVQTRAHFDVSGLAAREERASIDLGVRAVRAFGPLDLGGEMSVVGVVFRAQGTNTVAPGQETRLDLGARAGLVLRLGAARTRSALPFVGVHATFFPRPYDIVVMPKGVLGHPPSLWLGATVGVSVSR
jgi:hypothetical protein